MKRGTIKHRDRARQIIDASRLKWGAITPTDVDLSLDFGHGRFFVLIELKLRGAAVPQGQAEHLANLLAALNEARPGCVVGLVADHDVETPTDDVEAADAEIRRYWWKGRRMTPRRHMTVLDAIVHFRSVWGFDL